jgi:hypothetical protein
MYHKALAAEARRMTKLLKGKVVKVCKQHRSREVLVEFECGTRLFVDAVDAEGEVEISITGCEGGETVKGRKTGQQLS